MTASLDKVGIMKLSRFVLPLLYATEIFKPVKYNMNPAMCILYAYLNYYAVNNTTTTISGGV